MYEIVFDSMSAQAVDDIVSAAIIQQRIPGVSLAIARGGKMVYSKGYGYRSLPYRIAPDDRTIFSIASISKQFTAAAIMRFVERGTLSLDARIGQWFPSLKYAKDVTVRQLLQHLSGIPGVTEAPEFYLWRYSRATPDEIIATVSDRPLAFRPGDQYQYSNTNYVILGRLLELIGDASYADILQRELLDPIELMNTGVDDIPRIRDNEADPYTSYAFGDFVHAREWDPSWEFGAGGLYSDVRDLVSWNKSLRSGRVVRSETYASMATSGLLNNGKPTLYGFGLGAGDVDGVREVRHSGGLPGFTLENVTYPELDLDIVVLTNQNGNYFYFTIVRPILAVLLDRPELATWKRPVEVPPEARAAAPDPAACIAAVRDGRIDDLALAPSFRSFLTTQHRADLLKLGALGELRSAKLLDMQRRHPDTFFNFLLEFDGRSVLAPIHVRENGELSLIDFRAWDMRSM